MADMTNISSLSLGNTFGAWYKRTNDIIAGLNYRKVASITGGDGIIVTPHPSVTGGYTLDIASTVSKTVTFGNNVTVTGNLTVNGALNYSVVSDVAGTVMSIPYNAGVTLGNLIYIDSTGKAKKALADDECTAEVAGIVIGFTGSVAQICTSGKFSGSSLVSNFIGSAGATLTKGAVYFLSAGVSGAGTTIEPDITEYVSKPVVIGITGTDGLFIVHRGLIGGASGSNSNAGVCAGVSSLNSSSSSLYASNDDADNGIIKTQGDLFCVTSLNLQGSSDFKYSQISLLDRDPSASLIFSKTGIGEYYDNPYSSGVPTWNYKWQNCDANISYINSTLYSLFTTSGVTTDVWKLKNIKYVCDLPSPTKSESFALLRSINRLSTSNYINYLGHSDGAYESPGSSSIFYGKNIIGLVVGSGATVNGTYTPATNFTVLTPLINTPKDTQMPGGSNQPIGDGHTGGILYRVRGLNEFITYDTSLSNLRFTDNGFVEPSSTGLFPIIYGVDTYTNFASTFFNLDQGTVCHNRSYRWNIESHTIGGSSSSTSFVGEWLKSSFEGTDLDLSSPSGYTCDTAILGWNAQYGAIAETLHLKMFTPILYANNIRTKGCFYLEMKRYDINTKTEGETLIIPIQYQNHPIWNLLCGSDIPENQYVL